MLSPTHLLEHVDLVAARGHAEESVPAASHRLVQRRGLNGLDAWELGGKQLPDSGSSTRW